MEFLDFFISWHLVPYTWGFVLMYLWTMTAFNFNLIYLHSFAAHKHITIAPWFGHVIRFYLWMTSTIWYPGHVRSNTASHRIHHLFVDTDKDPFTVTRYSLRELFTYKQQPGAARYVSPGDIENYAEISVEPTDSLTRFYQRHQFKGWIINTAIWGVFMGPIGLIYGYLLQYYVQYAGTFIGDWLYHSVGYKHPHCKSEARNLWPWPLTEGLHSNHHVNPAYPNKAVRWFEIDFFYWTLRLYEILGAVQFTERDYSKHRASL